LAASFSWQFLSKSVGQRTDFKDQKRSATGNEPIFIHKPINDETRCRMDVWDIGATRANENIPSRHHRAKTTLEEQ